MNKHNSKAWLYLLPALLFLGAFMVYPLIDVFVYSAEEGYNFASQSYFGTGLYNYSYVLHDTYFLQAVKNTFILVIITVPVSTLLALLISLGLSSIRPLRDLYQTIYFLPYVTNTLAVGLVFMVLFQKTEYTDGLINLLIQRRKVKDFFIKFTKKSHFADFLTEQTLDFVLHRLFCGLAEMDTDDIGCLADLLSDSRASGAVGCGIVHSKSSCK